MRAFIAALLSISCACTESRPLQGEPARVSWREEIAPLFASRCATCHSAQAAAGGFDSSSYRSALRVAAPGDARSPLLLALGDGSAHAAVADVLPRVRAWVVEGRLSYFRSEVHAGGILDPRQAGEFHGSLLRRLSWDLAACARCHGADFAGGSSGVSCLQCHAQGPTSCDTCHGFPPATGAHAEHAASCAECHPAPVRWDDPGHLLASDGSLKGKAVVKFGELASLPGPGRAAPPSWDGARCSGVYCHGGAFQDASATSTAPSWSGGSSACGSCHGLPPADHGSGPLPCTTCHRAAAPHVDGTIDVGDGAGTCTGCHGSPLSLAPPRDVSGNTTTDAIGVGAHQAHLFAANFSSPVRCDACHRVPGAIKAPGHIDHPLPATVTFSGLATADGAPAAWDRSAATCATYCHGGGQKLAGDTRAQLRNPVWTQGASQVFCGSCHGLPPASPDHDGVTELRHCVLCHASSVDADGNLVFQPDGTTTHLDGVADVGR